MARYAKPVLAASMLIEPYLHDESGPEVVRSGCRAIDQGALNGGFRHGEVSAIAGSSGTGKTLMALHAIVTHLLERKVSEAALIDTNGFFSPLRMRDLVMSRLNPGHDEGFEQDGYVYRKAASKVRVQNEQLKVAVAEVLDRIKVMRVVDIIGVIEAIHEIGEICEKSHVHSTVRSVDAERPQKEGLAIPSSQDDDRMTPESVVAITEIQSLHQVPANQIRMLVIDNIANHASAELSNNQIGGQALLTSCMRSLRRITRQHKLCTLVINNVVGTGLRDGQHFPKAQVSVFASVQSKPALGKTFAHMLDTSILISNIPAKKADAQLAMDEKGNSQAGDWKRLLAIEVLYDRNGSREGRWSAFDVAQNGLELMSEHPWA